MNRRKFFSFLPLAPAAMVVEGVRAEEIDLAPKSSTVSISMMGSKPVPKNEINPYFIHSGYVSDPSKQVSLAVGEDGNLWIRSKNDNVWKKVATE